MRILPLFLLALYAALLSPPAFAMSLGEGIIMSQVGEHFSANIALLGDYDKDVRFSQVRGAECRASIIGKTANACDSLYEGQLVFIIRRRPDGQYFLRVNGERGEELFYRIIIKTRHPGSGTVYNAFEFLPEFRASQDAAPSEDGLATNALPSGKYGVVMDKIVEVIPDDPPREEPLHPAKKIAAPAPAKPADSPDKEIIPAAPKKVMPAAPRVSENSAKKPAEGRLQIAKYGEYSDDIFALQKENEEIERQISLLEKQISLLKEVANLKNQLGAPQASEVAATVPAATRAIPLVAHAVTMQAPPDQGGAELLKWVLFAVPAATLLLLLYRLKRRKRRNHSFEDRNKHVLKRFKHHDDDKPSLDLTGSFNPLKR